jgi:hypothetical protein
MHRTVNVFKAASFHDRVTDTLTIVADDSMPEGKESDTPEEIRRVFERQGSAIVEAMWATLPGGTLDAVLFHLMKRRSSMLHVVFPPAGL